MHSIYILCVTEVQENGRSVWPEIFRKCLPWKMGSRLTLREMAEFGKATHRNTFWWDRTLGGSGE